MPNKENGTYAKRQLARMLGLIEDYENGRIGIRKLISDFETLIELLEDLTQEKRDLLLSHWGVLGDVYAVTLDKEASEFDQYSRKLIEDALKMLKKLVGVELAHPRRLG